MSYLEKNHVENWAIMENWSLQNRSVLRMSHFAIDHFWKRSLHNSSLRNPSLWNIGHFGNYYIENWAISKNESLRSVLKMGHFAIDHFRNRSWPRSLQNSSVRNPSLWKIGHFESYHSVKCSFRNRSLREWVTSKNGSLRNRSLWKLSYYKIKELAECVLTKSITSNNGPFRNQSLRHFWQICDMILFCRFSKCLIFEVTCLSNQLFSKLPIYLSRINFIPEICNLKSINFILRRQKNYVLIN